MSDAYKNFLWWFNRTMFEHNKRYNLMKKYKLDDPNTIRYPITELDLRKKCWTCPRCGICFWDDTEHNFTSYEDYGCRSKRI